MSAHDQGSDLTVELLANRDARQRFSRALLKWFRVRARVLPWRPSPGLYETWISEIMLQQTQVATVIPYYTKFLERFPDVTSLAAANEREVLRSWEGLGYYRRARQLHAAAKRIVADHAGAMPTDVSAWRALPGIGRYTAGAILSIALAQRHPILEANTIRLYARLIGLREDLTSRASQEQLWALAELLVPTRRAGDFNQALMELGSLVCTPREPRCFECPVAKFCVTCTQGWQNQIPVRKRKQIYTAVREAAVVVRSPRGELLLRRCAADERWAGMWDFPRFTWESAGPVTATALRQHVHALTGVTLNNPELLATLKYGVTRYRITLDCFHAGCVRRSRSRQDLQWVRPTDLETFPLSVTGRKISRLLVHLPETRGDE